MASSPVLQDDQPDDRADPGQHVPEADDKGPHLHVSEVVGLDVEKLPRCRSVEEEHLDWRRTEVGHGTDQRRDLSHAVHDAPPFAPVDAACSARDSGNFR